jgi:hypothetical protein
VRCDRFEYDAAVLRDGLCRAEQFVGVDAVGGELDDIDVVTLAGAGDAAFEDGDALLGDGGLGCVAEDRDRMRSMVTSRGGGTIGSPVDTSQAAAPFHGLIDTATRTRRPG